MLHGPSGAGGASPLASELTGQGRGTIGDDDAIAEKLEALLPAKQGTFWKVLMTGQSELSATLDSLRKEGREALADLTDMLRRAVLATGGVPVDRFLELLEHRRDEAFLAMGPGPRRSGGESRYRESLEEQDRNDPGDLVREGEDRAGRAKHP